MRRLLSILMMLVLGLGPTVTAVPASSLASALRGSISGKIDESQLPACCRRNGRHHCALSAQAASAGAASRENSISANECCPCPPGTLLSTAPSITAIVSTHADSIALASEYRPANTTAANAQASDRRSEPKRGPPTPQIV
jgi:hypothetical protein